MVCITQTALHSYIVTAVAEDRIYGRYPSLKMAMRRVKQIETSRQTVRTSAKWLKAA